MADVGEADAFGHRHKANVGEALAAELTRPDRDRDARLRADLRPPVAASPTRSTRWSRPPSRTSRWTSSRPGSTGRMVAIQDGKYAHTALPDPALGPRKVDVPVMYNATRFRPRYDGKLGDPMLLVGLD